jgi:hypothetical protein
MSWRFPHGMVIFVTDDLFFVYIKCIKTPYSRASRQNTICLIPLQFVFVQLWRIYFVQNEQQNPNPNNIFWRFPRGMAIFVNDDLIFVDIKCIKTLYSSASRQSTNCPIPLQIRFCTTLEGPQ